MSFIDLAKRRYSVRAYQDKPVEADKIRLILEAAHVAPTAANKQPVRLVVVDDEEGMGKLAHAADVYGAPLAIVVCADRERAWKRPQDGKRTTDIDAAILTDHMMMEATDLGLGTVWICWFDPRTLAEQLSLTEELEPVNILAIGYADEPAADPERHATQRIPLESLVR